VTGGERDRIQVIKDISGLVPGARTVLSKVAFCVWKVEMKLPEPEWGPVLKLGEKGYLQRDIEAKKARKKVDFRQ